MKKSKLILALLAVMCLFAFSACGAEFDPVAYVQGNFDAVFHGEVTDEFIATLDDVDSAEDYKEEYEELLETTTDGIITSMGITEPTEVLKNDVKNMFVNVLGATKYEVSSEYVANDDGSFDVEVVAYPLLTYVETCNDTNGAITAAAEARVTADMTYEQIMTVVVEEMILAVNNALAAPVYGEPQTYTVHVYQDDDGLYTVDESDIAIITTTLMGA